MARYRSEKAKVLPPLLVRLIQAGRDSEDSDNKGSAKALRSFGALALVVVPTRGVFVPNDNDVGLVIGRVAKEHLGLEEAQRDFHEAVEAVELFEKRDAIESAHNHVQSVSDQAYFYAGLAFGVTLADFT